VAEEIETPERAKGLAVRHLDRFRHVPYPEIVDRVERLMDGPILRYRSMLTLDATGCGRPILDMFKRRNLRGLKAVTITGGVSESRGEDGVYYRVPKRDLVGGLQALLQSGRLKIANSLELAQTLRQELLNFKVKINVNTSHDSYEAWREGAHDDLVLATALAAWSMSKTPPAVAPMATRLNVSSPLGGPLSPSWRELAGPQHSSF
jgi:hypothetical protein